MANSLCGISTSLHICPRYSPVDIRRFEVLDSHFHYDASNYHRALDEVPVTDFFGSVSAVQPTPTLSKTAGDLLDSSSSSSSTWDLRPLHQAAGAAEAAAVAAEAEVSVAAAPATDRPLLQFSNSRHHGSSRINQLGSAALLPLSVYWGMLSLLAAVAAAAVLQKPCATGLLTCRSAR